MQSEEYRRSIAIEKQRRTQQRLEQLRAELLRQKSQKPPDEDGGTPVREPRRPRPGASPASVALELASV